MPLRPLPVLLALGELGTGLPAAAQSRSATALLQGRGYQLAFDQACFSRAEAGKEAKVVGRAGEPQDGVGPARVRFSLKPLAPAFVKDKAEFMRREAELRVFALEDPSGKALTQAYPAFARNLKRVKEILQAKRVAAPIGKDLPAWNMWECGQSIHARASRVETPWCIGLQYLTTCQQDVAVPENGNLTYFFEGISRDGKHFISAQIPIGHPALPLPGLDPDRADMKEITAYFLRVEKTLDAAPEDSFFPSLKVLRELLQSLAPRP